MIAVGFISSSSSLPIMWRVESFSGTCSDTTSEVRNSSRSRRNLTPCRSASSSDRRAMSKYCTCMPNGCASRATFLPMVPKPMMPSVLSCSSYMRGAGPLPRQRPPDTLPCCQITLR